MLHVNWSQLQHKICNSLHLTNKKIISCRKRIFYSPQARINKFWGPRQKILVRPSPELNHVKIQTSARAGERENLLNPFKRTVLRWTTQILWVNMQTKTFSFGIGAISTTLCYLSLNEFFSILSNSKHCLVNTCTVIRNPDAESFPLPRLRRDARTLCVHIEIIQADSDLTA